MLSSIFVNGLAFHGRLICFDFQVVCFLYYFVDSVEFGEDVK